MYFKNIFFKILLPKTNNNKRLCQRRIFNCTREPKVIDRSIARNLYIHLYKPYNSRRSAFSLAEKTKNFLNREKDKRKSKKISLRKKLAFLSSSSSSSSAKENAIDKQTIIRHFTKKNDKQNICSKL